MKPKRSFLILGATTLLKTLMLNRSRLKVLAILITAGVFLSGGAPPAQAQKLDCVLNPTACDPGQLNPVTAFEKKVGHPSRVLDLSHSAGDSGISGSYIPGKVAGRVDFDFVEYGPGDWDAYLWWNGIHFLTAVKYPYQTESITSHNLAALGLDDAATEELMLSVAEFFNTVSGNYPELAAVNGVVEAKKCKVEIELSLEDCPPSAKGVIFGGECKVSVKVKVKIVCETASPTK